MIKRVVRPGNQELVIASIGKGNDTTEKILSDTKMPVGSMRNALSRLMKWHQIRAIHPNEGTRGVKYELTKEN